MMEAINKLCNNLMLLTPKISRLKPIFTDRMIRKNSVFH